MRVVVTGAAGFLGSHLCDALLARGDEVVGVDNFSTGRSDNLAGAREAPAFSLVEQDACERLAVGGAIDAIAHLACPASPPDYLRLPVETLRVSSIGTEMAVDLAARHDARLLLASTSEVYGDPLVHPQTETYWGNVNPIGPRSVYDEAKRFAEALTMAHCRANSLDAGIVRIFNTYGPRLRRDDGRVVSNFVTQSLDGAPLTIYGDGSQTRSFCFVSDLVAGLVAMIDREVLGPVNLGNPVEVTMLELARRVLALTGSSSPIVTAALPVDDPGRRCPDISTAAALLDWRPLVGLDEGLGRTIAWYREVATRVPPVPHAPAGGPGPRPDRGIA